MKQAMTSIDVAVIVSELQHLVGSRIEKIYKTDTGTDIEQIRLNLYLFGEGRSDLVITPGAYVCLTAHPLPGPKTPAMFAMTLRKYLSHGRIVSIEQYDFDRIIEIKTMRGEVENGLILELFPPGNVILVNHEQKIILPLHPVTFRGRRIRSGEVYKLPDMQSNPVEITKDGLSALFSESDMSLVKTLATRLNMGGVIAEEVCSHLGIDKNTGCQDLSDEVVETVHRGIAHVFGQMANPKPHITYKDENKIDVLPFEISRYTDRTKRYFNTFSEALDEFFGVAAKEQAIEKKPDRKQNPLEHRLTQQENAIRKFEHDKSDLSAKAEAVYTHYQPVDELLGLVRQELADGRTWDEIRAEHSEIKRTDPRNRTITIELDGMSIPLDTGKNVPQNAQVFYDRSKKIGSKLDGAVRAIENTRELLKERVKKPKTKMPAPKRPKPRWYDQYRWFRTSDGLLVIGGRGATSNEEIVKKYLEKRDIFMHSQAPGAPVTIIKVDKGAEVSEQTIAEAAQFAISYSSIWKSGQYTGDCYWVNPDQVSKTPEHGEFVSKGAFIIRGTRNYLKDVSVGLAIGITSDLHLIGGPVSAVSNHAKNVVEIVPGRFNQNDIAKKIYRIFSDALGRSIKVVASPDQIAKFLPPGESDIKSKGK
ncbi:MAG: fibronectin-binding domain-containing protein [Candidatus Methanogaster sp.]|uniref:Fibronectin-binding domain-containing protein n=1 Tax=Candidatus Methanogaster sp. TaxID=3386292 RepID=A0AC61KYS2_9EURY|nr:MAG: fibronectin-binding domain-containing protein [ANME-2 cluster archaeon]